MILFIHSSTPEQFILSSLVVLFLLGAVITYIIALNKGKLAPRPISWIGWALIMGVGLFSQVITKGWHYNQIGLAFSILGCMIIATLSLKHGVIEPGDWVCLLLGFICIGIYLASKNTWTTTIVAVIADLMIAIPTQHNAYRDPLSEKSIAWHFGAAAYLVNCIACIGNDFIYAAFPLYLLLMNSSMVFLTTRKVFKLVP